MYALNSIEKYAKKKKKIIVVCSLDKCSNVLSHFFFFRYKMLDYIIIIIIWTRLIIAFLKVMVGTGGGLYRGNSDG